MPPHHAEKQGFRSGTNYLIDSKGLAWIPI
jgi:hypothetical protein